MCVCNTAHTTASQTPLVRPAPDTRNPMPGGSVDNCITFQDCQPSLSQQILNFPQSVYVWETARQVDGLTA